MTIKIESLHILPCLVIFLSKCWKILCVFTSMFVIIYCLFGGFLATTILFITTGSFFYFSQDYILYHPNDNVQSREIVQNPNIYDLPFQNVFVKSLDGTLIHLYFIKHENNPAEAPTVVFFHGNAGNVGHRLYNAVGLYKNIGCNILMVEYRGYGLSKGFPSENGIYMDAMAALDFLASRPDINHNKIIVFGRSLGGAVAIDLASRPDYGCRIWCLIIENTFTSIPDMAAAIFRSSLFLCLPLFLYKNKYMSKDKMKNITVPTLLISGMNDLLVPPYMMGELYERCSAELKHLFQVRDGGHNDTWTSPGYYSSISTFINGAHSYCPKPPSTSVSNV